MSWIFVVVALMIASVSRIVSGQTLPPRKVAVEKFDVVGITCRTNNAKEASPKGCIGQQWAHLLSEGLVQKIPNRANNSIVAVYTDYDSDRAGNFTYILGAKVNTGTSAPPGMVKMSVKSGQFAVFTSDKGPVQQVVLATWNRIWELPKSQLGGDRIYQSDFEVYDSRATDPANSQIDIFIRVR